MYCYGDIVVKSEISLLARKGLSQLQYYLVSSVVCAVLTVTVTLSMISYLEALVEKIEPVDLFYVVSGVVIITAAQFTPQILYYNATRSLVSWSRRFNKYKYLVLLSITVLALLKSLTCYMFFKAVRKYNYLLAPGEGLKPPILIDIAFPFEFYSAYESVAGGLFNIVLLGVFNALRGELKALQTNNPAVEGKAELYELSRVTIYLRISQLLLLVGGFFAYIHGSPKYTRTLGIAVLIFGLVMLVISTIRAHNILEAVKKHL